MPRCPKCSRLVPPKEMVEIEVQVKVGETRHTEAPREGTGASIFGMGGRHSGTSEHFKTETRKVCGRCAGGKHAPIRLVHLLVCAIVGIAVVALLWLILRQAPSSVPSNAIPAGQSKRKMPGNGKEKAEEAKPKLPQDRKPPER